jgi:hypothetical protein
MAARVSFRVRVDRAIKVIRPSRLLHRRVREVSLKRSAARHTRNFLDAGLLNSARDVSVRTRKIASDAVFQNFCARYRFFIVEQNPLPNLVLLIILGAFAYTPILSLFGLIWLHWPTELRVQCVALAFGGFTVQFMLFVHMVFEQRIEDIDSPESRLLASTQLASILTVVGIVVGALESGVAGGLYGAAACLLSTAALASFFALLALPTFGMTAIPDLMWERRNPHVAVKVLLSRCLNTLVQGDFGWDRKRRILSDLDRAARLVAVRIPMRLGLDPLSDELAISRFRRTAGLLQHYRSWIATPNCDTYSALFDELEEMLRVIDSGHWDILPEGDHEYVESKTRTSLFKNLARCLLAIIPLGCLGVLAVLGIDLGPVVGYVTALSLVWAAIGFVATWHPNWAGELVEARETLRDIKRA